MTDEKFYSDAFDARLDTEVAAATTMSDMDGARKRSHTAARTLLHAKWDTDGEFQKPRKRHHRTELIRFHVDERNAKGGAPQAAYFAYLESALTTIEARLDVLEA